MYEDIKQQFKEVIKYSQHIEDPNVEYLFREWSANKEKFINLFGGLIYEWPQPVEFTLDEHQKRNRAMEFADIVADSFNNSDLAGFIDDNIDTFFENKVSNDNYNGIPKGMKLLKAFKYFEDNKCVLRNIQDMASQIIQEDKIKGTLCFSVHPLDFLSSSENTYNWRSCHSLDGEFRAGNLSYMVDDCTFMIYLKGADNQTLYNFGSVKWNSKKWRMLVHANEAIMFAGRQYPFSSKSGIDMALNVYNNLIAKKSSSGDDPYWYYFNRYSPWTNEYIDKFGIYQTSLDSKYIIYNYRLADFYKVVKKGNNALNFNDVLESSCYTYPYYSIQDPYCYNGVEYLLNHPLTIGGEVPCLHCGDEVILNPETMRCDDCELKYGIEENDVYGTCDCCGARIYIDDANVVNNGNDYVCDSCYDKYCFTCDCCGEVFYNSEKIFIPEDEYEDCGSWYCSYCAQNKD